MESRENDHHFSQELEAVRIGSSINGNSIIFDNVNVFCYRDSYSLYENMKLVNLPALFHLAFGLVLYMF